jgi:ammonia channel protein AmtB
MPHTDVSMTVWAIVSMVLVLLVQGGLLARGAGIVRAKNAAHLSSVIVAGFTLTGILYWALGRAMIFGESSGGLVGVGGFAAPLTSSTFIAFAVCALVGTIPLPALAERTRFGVSLLVVVLGGGLLGPLFAHGLTPDGWLKGLGFVDWGGAAVIHLAAGSLTLGAVLAVGPRRGRFTRTGRAIRIPPWSPALVGLGVFMAWAGWIGLAATAVEAPPVGMGHAAMTTVLAGGAGGFMAVLLGIGLRRRVEAVLAGNGVLAGLIAVSGAPASFSPPFALLVAAVAATVMYSLDRLFLRLQIDDAAGVVPVHLGAGLVGALAVGVVGDPVILGTGLARTAQITAQLQGLGAILGVGFGLSTVVLQILKRITSLRVEPAAEAEGLNRSQQRLTDAMEDAAAIVDREAQIESPAVPSAFEAFAEMARVTFTPEGGITSANAVASAMFGYGEREFRRQVVPSLFLPRRDGSRWDVPSLAKAATEGRELLGVRRTGEEFPIEVQIAGEGILSLRDITVRKATEEGLNRMEAELRRRLEGEIAESHVAPELPAELTGCEMAVQRARGGADWFEMFYGEDESLTIVVGSIIDERTNASLLSQVADDDYGGAAYTHGLLLGNASYPPERQLRNLAEVINRIVLETGKGEILLAMTFVNILPSSGDITYLNAGNEDPPYVKSGSRVKALSGGGSPLGSSDTPNFTLHRAKMAPEEVLLVYTSGVLASFGADGRAFSSRELKRVLSAGENADLLRDEIVLHSKLAARDRTDEAANSLVVIRRAERAISTTS